MKSVRDDIKFTDKKYDSLDERTAELVYQLYGLTEDEIKIVEGN